METLEISQIDTRYERLRLRNAKQEQALFYSILKKGIQDPLYVIKVLEDNKFLLLDGHKRRRIAEELGISTLPVTILETGVVPGIIKFIKFSNDKGLSQIEQACLVDELHNQQSMSITDIAEHLERSPSWVRMRLGILEQMDDSVRERIMSGNFPFRNYMYSLHKRTRVRNVSKRSIAQFVEKTAGKGLSTRDIDMLSKGYFSGNKNIKEQINQGKLDWTLRQLKLEEQAKKRQPDDFNEYETKALSQLDWAFVCMNRVPLILSGNRFEHSEFFKKASELCSNILKRTESFISSLKEFYDRASKTPGCGDSL